MVEFKPIRVRLDLDQQIENAFSDQLRSVLGIEPSMPQWAPAIDLYETDSAFVIEADLPGVDAHDLSVVVERDWLMIRGRRVASNRHQTHQGIVLERQVGEFHRSFRLTHPVDAARMTVEQQQGVFVITVPKRLSSEEAGPADAHSAAR